LRSDCARCGSIAASRYIGTSTVEDRQVFGAQRAGFDRDGLVDIGRPPAADDTRMPLKTKLPR